ncbi:MAG: ceramidase domain-containing protein [Pseudomonadota bacterium]
MDWTTTIDGYCERLDTGFWAEPINAMTNIAFLLAALIMAWRTRQLQSPLCTALVVVLAAIGVGSFLFHTFATVWSAVTDVVPIVSFVMIYVFLANRHYLGLSLRWALLGTAAFVPYVAITVSIFQQLPFFNISSGYWPLPFLIAGYAVFLRKRLPSVALGLFLGSALLCISLFFRTIDLPLCSAFPTGTHLVWHVLNAIMLGWMIETYRRHVLATGTAGS